MLINWPEKDTRESLFKILVSFFLFMSVSLTHFTVFYQMHFLYLFKRKRRSHFHQHIDMKGVPETVTCGKNTRLLGWVIFYIVKIEEHVETCLLKQLTFEFMPFCLSMIVSVFPIQFRSHLCLQYIINGVTVSF